jgi:hypothetical protein
MIYKPHPNGVAQRVTQNRMVMLDGLRAKARVYPSVVGLLNLTRLQLRNLHPTERRDELLLDNLGVPLERLSRDVRSGVGKPMFDQQRSHGEIGRRYEIASMYLRKDACKLHFGRLLGLDRTIKGNASLTPPSIDRVEVEPDVPAQSSFL